MRDLFISHVEEDAEIALELARGLEDAGYVTWYYERDNLPGPSYLAQIGAAIEDCRAFALIISAHSLGSHQVTAEIERAYEAKRPFLPLLRGITHSEFQSRQPLWRQALGSASSLALPARDARTVLPRVIEGLQMLRIHPSGPVRPPAPIPTQAPVAPVSQIPLWHKPSLRVAAAAVVLTLALLAIAFSQATRPTEGTRAGATSPLPTRAHAITAGTLAAPAEPTQALGPAEAALYCQGFEQGAPAWQLDQGWAVTDGAICGQGYSWAQCFAGSWADHRVVFRLRLQTGSIRLCYRVSANQRYFVTVADSGISLSKLADPRSVLNDLAISSASLNMTEWHQVEIAGQGGRLRVAVDGQTALEYADPDPIPEGRLAFEALAGSAACIDDIVVYGAPTN